MTEKVWIMVYNSEDDIEYVVTEDPEGNCYLWEVTVEGELPLAMIVEEGTGEYTNRLQWAREFAAIKRQEGHNHYDVGQMSEGEE